MRDLKEIEKRYKDPNRIPKRGRNLFKKRYLSLSATEVTWDEEKRTIGFGIFGHVFLFPAHFKSQKIHA
jgi:hypothetical protein